VFASEERLGKQFPRFLFHPVPLVPPHAEWNKHQAPGMSQAEPAPGIFGVDASGQASLTALRERQSRWNCRLLPQAMSAAKPPPRAMLPLGYSVGHFELPLALASG